MADGLPIQTFDASEILTPRPGAMYLLITATGLVTVGLSLWDDAARTSLPRDAEARAPSP
ncbi:hypothetical protein GCM10017673_09620 [Streptosporangium violaceochromogenes]|nr:hypothetical protein GCM10017673_09620 [Streptosporangium violaceochromogenes]